MSTSPASWLSVNFQERKDTRVVLTVLGPGFDVYEFTARFVWKEYGATVLSLSTDRADQNCLVLNNWDGWQGAVSDEPTPKDFIATCPGRPPLEALLDTSRRLPRLNFSLLLGHGMYEGTISVQAGAVLEDSVMDWTERDEELWRLPGPGEPWKPRETRED